MNLNPATSEAQPPPAAVGRSWRTGRAVHVAIAVVVLAFCFAPMALSSKAYFTDWANHLWIVDQQREWMARHLLPTYFLHSDNTGAFYPLFAFYGGSAYAVAGGLAAIVGSQAAFAATWIGGGAVAYAGTYALARLIGTSRYAAHVPAIVVVTSTYYLTDAYGRGAWTEFIAVSAVPALLYGVVGLLIEERARQTRVAVVILSTAMITGTHAITSLFGALFIVAAVPGIVAVLDLRPTWREAFRRAGWPLMGAAIGIGLNAWFLLPAARFGRQTHIASTGNAADLLVTNEIFSSARVVLSPVPFVPTASTTPGLATQVPSLVLAFILMLLVIRIVQGRPVRALLPLLALNSVLVVLVMATPLWQYMPALLEFLQFQYRLVTYVAICTAAVLAALLRDLRPAADRAFLAAAAVLAVVLVGIGGHQALNSQTYQPISDVLQDSTAAPPGFYAAGDYRFRPVVPAAAPPNGVEFSIDQVRTAGQAESQTAAGELHSNLVNSPFIEVNGAEVTGVDERSLLILRSNGRVSVTPKLVPTMVLGLAITGISVLLLLALLVVAAARALRPKRDPAGALS